MFRLDHLPNQRENEHVILFLRRHWIALFGIILAAIILILIPIGIGVYYWPDVQLLLSDPIWGPLMTILGSIFVLTIWLYTFLQFTDYYLDTWIITNERIINIEQNGLFNRTASELDLASVQDTTAEIHGIVQMVLGYGNVYVQTAGEKGRFHFKNISEPEHVKEIVTKLVEEDKQRVSNHGKVKTVIK